MTLGCHGDNTALILCALVAQDQWAGGMMQKNWFITQLGVPTQGKTFQDDVCKTAMRMEVDKFIDEGLKCERVLSMETTFTMKKNDVAQLPSNIDAVIIGLGWDCDGDIDLDASIICLDQQKNKTDIIDFSNKNGSGISHRGDNTTGAGSGDDERIRIDLHQVPLQTTELYVTVNIYSNGITFSKVRNAYVRVTSAKNHTFDTGHIFAKYPLDGSIPTRGLVFIRFVRQHGTWIMNALGWGCGGSMAKDTACMDVVTGKVAPVAMSINKRKG